MDDKPRRYWGQRETSQETLAEIKQQLPRMATLLNTLPDRISVRSYERQEYMRTSHRDRMILALGAIEGVPQIQDSRSQDRGQRPGIGMYVYRSSLRSDLKYILYIVSNPDGGILQFLIMDKGNIYHYERCASRLNKLANMPKDAPILAEGLLDEIVQNTIGFLLRAREIKKYGVKIKRGLILDGPPGNGKSMLCRYIQNLCTQHDIDYGIITSAEIESAYAQKSLNELFQTYTVSFFDDIDVGYMNRNKGNGKMACSILTAMDGMEEVMENDHLIRIFTTNEAISELDPAFTRPGRIDKCITIEKPNKEMRRRLMETWPLEIRENINIDEAAERSKGFSFAELEAIRTFLVTNKILGTVKGWDLDRAFEDYESRSTTKKNSAVGFA